MIRVLHDLSALDGGGVAKLLYDYYQHMDHEVIHFDFMIYNFYDEGIYEQSLKDMGCYVYKLPTYKQDSEECTRQRERIIREGHYDVLHTHFGIGGFRTLEIANKCGVPKRIAHSHIAYEPISFKTKVANVVKKFIALRNATNLMACGVDAGEYMWGSKAVRSGKVHIMTNAVDTQKFKFDNSIRNKKRHELGIEDKYVIGIVGRLSEQKNYPFLFKVYKEVLKHRNNTVLLVIGRGLEENKIRGIAREMEIEKNICFLGVRDDVAEILNAMDVFVLPSLYEGLPVVLIEAQANGLHEFVSDRVTKEMNVSDLIDFLAIDQESVRLWVNKICSYDTTLNDRDKYCDIIKEAGYDIRLASKEMEQYYTSL